MGQGDGFSHLLRGEGIAFGRGLYFDEIATAGHGDVEVGVGAKVLFVAEIEEKGIADDADAYGGDGVAEGDALEGRRS